MLKFPKPVDLINGRLSRTGLTVTRDIAYGTGPRQKLDFYRPAGAAGNLPVIMFFYGGSWQFGERRDYAFIAARLARRGYAVAVPDYRLFPDVVFPAFLEDAAAATAWAVRHAKALGANAGTLFLAGHSAGAYIAVMLGLDRAYLRAEGLRAERLAGVIGLAGPYDFLPLGGAALREIFDNGGDPGATQPINHVRADAPPMFLLTGAKDRTVLPRNTATLAARLRALGGVVETRTYPSLGHVGIVTSLLGPLAWRAPVLRDITGFMAGCRAGEFTAAHADAAEPIN